MQTIVINPRVKIDLYGSIKELPVRISKEFNRYYLQDAGIGSTIADVDEHLYKLLSFSSAQDTESVGTEATNLRFTFFSILEKWDYKSLSFACLIKTVHRQGTGKSPVLHARRATLSERISGLPRFIESTSYEDVPGEWVSTPVTDYTAPALSKLIDELSDDGLTVAMVEDTVADVKKNLMPSGSYTSRNSLQPM